mmetsp:Transcript_29156/g.73214  ORF Transcript_29156/g.73214 Transcript_29156/m.73214 type:complete len:239 (+) Transcript_29156:301-1017(+)
MTAGRLVAAAAAAVAAAMSDGVSTGMDLALPRSALSAATTGFPVGIALEEADLSIGSAAAADALPAFHEEDLTGSCAASGVSGVSCTGMGTGFEAAGAAREGSVAADAAFLAASRSAARSPARDEAESERCRTRRRSEEVSALASLALPLAEEAAEEEAVEEAEGERLRRGAAREVEVAWSLTLSALLRELATRLMAACSASGLSTVANGSSTGAQGCAAGASAATALSAVCWVSWIC